MKRIKSILKNIRQSWIHLNIDEDCCQPSWAILNIVENVGNLKAFYFPHPHLQKNIFSIFFPVLFSIFMPAAFPTLRNIYSSRKKVITVVCHRPLTGCEKQLRKCIGNYFSTSLFTSGHRQGEEKCLYLWVQLGDFWDLSPRQVQNFT